MPQPKNAPKAAEKAAEKQPDETIVGKLLTQGTKLADEKTGLFERIGTNRDALRMLQKSGVMTDDESGQVDKLYPPVKREKKDAVESGDNGAAATSASDGAPASTDAK